MAELVVVGFDNPTDADRVLTELTRLQKEYLIDLKDTVVAIGGQDGAMRIKQSVNLVSLGAASGVPVPASPGCRAGGSGRQAIGSAAGAAGRRPDAGGTVP